MQLMDSRCDKDNLSKLCAFAARNEWGVGMEKLSYAGVDNCSPLE